MSTQGEFFEIPQTANNEPADTKPVAVKRGMKDLSIPKLYYSISEVSRLTGLEQYVLRYWETEFDELRPQKNRAGNRIYSNKDIKFILKIKELLREKRYTIEGAKQILRDESDVDREAERHAFAADAIAEPPKSDPGQLKIEEPKDTAALKATLSTLGEMRSSIAALKSLLSRK
jgi:DNA-binding transcriptional MerR regulator